MITVRVVAGGYARDILPLRFSRAGLAIIASDVTPDTLMSPACYMFTFDDCSSRSRAIIVYRAAQPRRARAHAALIRASTRA